MWLGFSALLILLLLMSQCVKDVAITDDQIKTEFNPTPVTLDYPSLFPILSQISDNPLTVEGIYLGRKLYYDSLLHPYKLHSCASCHLQSQSFSIDKPGTAVLAHVNIAWGNHFLWNGSIEGNMDDIMRFEVEDFFQTDIKAFDGNKEYQDLFYKAFGTKEISTELCAKALSQFITTLISTKSRFDYYYFGGQQLSQDELDGYAIFNSEKGDCFHCHTPPLFTDHEFHNIGLDSTFSQSTSGRYQVTGNSSDLGAFKTPTLRNIAQTPPYMHDGRYKTLEEVIDHYDHGVKYSESLDPIMTKAGKEDGLNLTVEEKGKLLSFLYTLTDTSFLKNPDFRKPD
jgi:cytochrome c peroxidase